MKTEGDRGTDGTVRCDKWLWAVRVFRHRAEATAACDAGHVTLNERLAKPGKPLRPGDVVAVRLEGGTRTLRVLRVTEVRTGAPGVAENAEDLTPESEREKARRSFLDRVLDRPVGSGRPTKRERREWDAAFGSEGESGG